MREGAGSLPPPTDPLFPEIRENMGCRGGVASVHLSQRDGCIRALRTWTLGRGGGCIGSADAPPPPQIPPPSSMASHPPLLHRPPPFSNYYASSSYEKGGPWWTSNTPFSNKWKRGWICDFMLIFPDLRENKFSEKTCFHYIMKLYNES
nr:hypothetical protein [Morchella crassipes]